MMPQADIPETIRWIETEREHLKRIRTRIQEAHDNDQMDRQLRILFFSVADDLRDAADEMEIILDLISDYTWTEGRGRHLADGPTQEEEDMGAIADLPTATPNFTDARGNVYEDGQMVSGPDYVDLAKTPEFAVEEARRGPSGRKIVDAPQA